jgi:hypothetical protein
MNVALTSSFLLAVAASCSPPSTATPPSACGTPNASSKCESVTWPRISITFGDADARNLTYSFRTNDGMTFSDRNSCWAGYGESTNLHCDLAFYAGTTDTVVTVQISRGDGGAPLLSRDIPLTPFNYCGKGIAQVVVTIGDAGLPAVSEVQYLDACGGL